MAKRVVKRRAVLATYIYDTLRQDIVSGKFKIGGNVDSENALCKRFKASRMTVRSGLKRLSADGLIQAVPGRGWRVTSDSPRKRPIDARPVLLSGTGSTDSNLCLEAARKVLVKTGHEIQIRAARGKSALGSLDWKKISGSLFYSGTPLKDSIVGAASASSTPLVCAMLSQQESYDTVSCDHFGSTAECMDHLIRKGMTRIGYLSNRHLDEESDDPSFRQRKAAYEAAMAKIGAEPLVFLSKYNHAIGYEEGERFGTWLKDLKKRGKPLEALFVTVRPLLEFALWQMHSHGVSAKKDITVIGATEQVQQRLLDLHGMKKILLLRAPYEKIGELAARRLSDRIAGDDSPAYCTMLKSDLTEVAGSPDDPHES